MSPRYADSAEPSVSTRCSQAVVSVARECEPHKIAGTRAAASADGASTTELRKRLLQLIVANEKSRRADVSPSR